MPRLKDYLADPLLADLYAEVRAAGPMRAISVDLTHKCNLRCTGCYYFAEGMDALRTPADDTEFDAFIERELERGTNFVTVVGGEPALRPERLAKLHANFKVNVATNGLIRIPREGLEDLPLGIAVWGDHDTDARLRGAPAGRDFFAEALENYRGDDRAFFYYTVAPGHAHEVESVVEQCVANGNRVLFNYYSDVERRGGALGPETGFGRVRDEIDRMIERYPEMIYTTRYFNEVVTRGELFGQQWGFEVCTNLSTNAPGNQARFGNGEPYNPHFRAYNADFTSTRRCCTGVTRDCATCYDTWEHFSWIMINMRRHLGSADEFFDWLTTMFAFYVVNRLVDLEAGHELLAAAQARSGSPLPAARTA